MQDIANHFHRDGPVVRVTIIDARGSTPREMGAAMMVSVETVAGTIGGGALEYDAIAHARMQLEKDADQAWQRDVKDYPLGPRLGQCCGGHVRLLFERYGVEEMAALTGAGCDEAFLIARPLSAGSAPIVITPTQDMSLAPGFVRALIQTQIDESNSEFQSELVKGAGGEWFTEPLYKKRLPIFLYGAGHVGREVVRVFEGLAAEITWIDTDENRFPEPVPNHVQRLAVAAPHEAVAYAPDDAFHIVMSYSHPLDLEICHAVLKRGSFQYLGLIGSMTKRGRFLNRLKKLGVKEADLSRLTCPIGAGGPASKDPAVIAISLAAEILRLAETPQNYQETD